MSDQSIYAKPVIPRIVVRPALTTVLLHAGVLYLLTTNWLDSGREVVTVKPAPQVINAHLVDASELKPKPKPKPKAAAKPKPRPAPKAKAKPVPKTAPKVAPKAAPKPAPQAQARPEPRPEPRITPQELARAARADLARALAEEEAQAAAAATADEMAASYAALIQRTVVNYWSRPPSARNGMEALLSIQLIPTGDVVSVSVIRSSGSAAFDRSAVNAVEKAGSFPELQNLPAGEFEKTFRRFRLLFRPEDLRY
ncbi:MAG: cell envelope integrity protein TolA [Halioglobus sp.]|nr:cell envelope integrity protein TolA [Halioglobus sp.]